MKNALNAIVADRLDEEQFTFRKTKDGKLIISFRGRVVTVVNAKAARKHLDKLERGSPREVQAILAKLTGNFKRGNERQGKARRR